MLVNKVSLGLKPLATTKTNIDNRSCTKPLPFDSVSFGGNTKKLQDVVFFEYNNIPIPQLFEMVVDKSTNKIISKTVFQQDGKTKISEEFYYPDTDTPKEKKFYDYNGDKIDFVYEYDRDGKHVATKDFDYNRQRYFRTFYRPGNKQDIFRVETYDLRDDQLKATKTYQLGVLRNLKLYNPDKTLKKQIVFYSDGKTPRIQYEFDKNGNLIKTTYMKSNGAIETVIED